MHIWEDLRSKAISTLIVNARCAIEPCTVIFVIELPILPTLRNLTLVSVNSSFPLINLHKILEGFSCLDVKDQVTCLRVVNKEGETRKGGTRNGKKEEERRGTRGKGA